MEPEAREPSPNLATVAHLSSPKLRDASQKWVKVVRLSSPKLRYKSPKLATVAHLSSPKLCYESPNGRMVPLVRISRINHKPGKEIKGKKHPPNR